MLVISAREGDKNATAEILERLRPFIVKTSKSIFLNGYEIEDLIQIGYITLLKAIMKFKSDGNNKFLPYAISAIKNNYYYEIRKKCKLNAESSLNIKIQEDFEIIDNICSEENIEESLINKEINANLLGAIGKLTEDEKDLIIQFYFIGNKMKDYAESHNINYTALAKKKGRILAKLKKLMESCA